jgi:hypothetical protein
MMLCIISKGRHRLLPKVLAQLPNHLMPQVHVFVPRSELALYREKLLPFPIKPTQLHWLANGLSLQHARQEASGFAEAEGAPWFAFVDDDLFLTHREAIDRIKPLPVPHDRQGTWADLFDIMGQMMAAKKWAAVGPKAFNAIQPTRTGDIYDCIYKNLPLDKITAWDTKLYGELSYLGYLDRYCNFVDQLCMLKAGFQTARLDWFIVRQYNIILGGASSTSAWEGARKAQAIHPEHAKLKLFKDTEGNILNFALESVFFPDRLADFETDSRHIRFKREAKDDLEELARHGKNYPGSKSDTTSDP